MEGRILLPLVALALVTVAVAGPAAATPFGGNSITVPSHTVGPVTTPSVTYTYGCNGLPYSLTVGNKTILYTPTDMMCPLPGLLP